MLKKIIVGAAAAGLALTLAPAAQAEEVVTVQQLCSYDSPVMQPHFKPGKGLTCAPSASVFVPGIALPVMAAHWDGAYPVDPANQWSDWVLPAVWRPGTRRGNSPVGTVARPWPTIPAMTDEGMSEWAKTALKLLAVPGEIVVSAHGFPGFVTAGGILLESLAPKRRNHADEFAGVVIAFVGRDKLFDIVQSDDERGEMLFSGAQASMSTGHDGKRILMARVVANAMTSDEPIDEAQLMLWALIALEAPHFRSLKRIQVTQDDNRDSEHLDSIMYELLKAFPYPVLATLARTGVVRQGSEKRRELMYSVTYADTLAISGISDFGRKLLADLESVNTRL